MSELPPDLRKEYDAPFAIISPEEGSRYTSLISRDFHPPRCLDFDLIENLQIRKSIESHCRTLGFENIVKMNHDAYEQLMLQFYTTFNSGGGGAAQFSCRLMGRNVTVTCQTLCDIFGFREGGHRTVPKEFDPVGFWKEISDGSRAFKHRASSRLIKDPVLLLMHRYISHTVFGRADSSKVTVKDLFYLWCLRSRVDVATPCFLIRTFNKVVTSKLANMCLGNLITAIALHFGALVDTTGMKVLPTWALRFARVATIKNAFNAAKKDASSSDEASDGEDDNPAVDIVDQPAGLSTIKNALEEGNCDNVAKEDAFSSSSSDQAANGEDTNPVAIDDQSDGLGTTPPAVDSWMLISREMEQMQTRMNDGFNDLKAGFDSLEKKVDAICAQFQTFKQEWADFKQRESNDGNNVEKMNRGNFVAHRTIKKLRPEKSDSDKGVEMCKTSIQKLSMRVTKIEDGLAKISSLNVVELANFVNVIRELGTFQEGKNLEFPDSRGKNDSLGNRSMPDVDAHDEAEYFPGVRSTSNSVGSKGISENDDNNSPEPLIRDGDIAHTVKKSPCSQTGHNLPQPGRDECKVAHAIGKQIMPGGAQFYKCSSSAAARDIIEIHDSDNEINHNGAAESSKRVPSSNETNLVRRRKRNRTETVEDLFSFSTTKVKEVFTVDEKNALIYEKETGVLKSSHDNVDCSPSERFVETRSDSQNGLNDEVSADSEDESLSDSRMEDLIASLRKENCVKKYMYEADMLRAFQQDEELCLNAVCALYRQTVSAKKSNGSLTLSENNGFSPIDSLSGCAVAEYLIDGDKELRLTKSVSQVRRHRPDVITLCRKLAVIYVKKLFEIYCVGDDLFCQS